MDGFRVEVRWRGGLTYAIWDCGIEQRKTALRRVEMELDEADEMVRTSLLLPSYSPPTLHKLFP